MAITKDEGLKGNEKIEECIDLLRKEPSDEALAVTLTAIRCRMKEKGQFIVAVEPNPAAGMQVKTMTLKDGQNWIPVFTSFEEEMIRNSGVMSTFLADIDQLFQMVLNEPNVAGLLLNPWNRTMTLNKTLIQVIQG